MTSDSEAQLREKFRTIERLVADAVRDVATAEANSACAQVCARLVALAQQSPPIDVQFSIPDVWSRQLFSALCRRYGLQPFRYGRQKRTTVMARVPRPFVDEILWPAFQALDQALAVFLKDGASRAIHAEIDADTSEPTLLPAPPLGRDGS